MANIKSAKKRIVTSEKCRQRNASCLSALKTSIKKVNKAIQEKDIDAAQNRFKTMQSMLDHQASSNLIHKNKAARYKSRLSSQIKKLS